MFGLPLTYEPVAQQAGMAFSAEPWAREQERVGLSEALNEMFGPAADTADRIVEILDDETLSEEERKELLRKIELKTGSGSGMEKLMVKDMEKQYAEGKVRGR